MFKGNQATIGVDGRSAQTVIDLFKKYLLMATRSYQTEVNREIANREQQARKDLQAQRAAAAERLKVNSNLKI